MNAKIERKNFFPLRKIHRFFAMKFMVIACDFIKLDANSLKDPQRKLLTNERAMNSDGLFFANCSRHFNWLKGFFHVNVSLFQHVQISIEIYAYDQKFISTQCIPKKKKNQRIPYCHQLIFYIILICIIYYKLLRVKYCFYRKILHNSKVFSKI